MSEIQGIPEYWRQFATRNRMEVNKTRQLDKPSKLNYIITRILLETLLKNERITVIDCGSAGGSLLPWYALGNRIVRYGFDPVETDCVQRNAQAKEAGLPHFYYPLYLAERNQQSRKFYLTNYECSSSLYQPDEKSIARWAQLRDGKRIPVINNLGIKQVTEVNTTNLDTWAKEQKVKDIDFIKSDVQGADLEVLSGGKELLQTALGLIVEVCFTPVYKNQPLFADIDTFLRNQKFTLFSQYINNAGQFAGRVASPIAAASQTSNEVNTFQEQQAAGQLLAADVLYLRDAIAEQDLSIIKILKLVCISEMCNQFEYSFELLDWVTSTLTLKGNVKQAKLVKKIFNQAKGTYQNKGVLVRPLL